MTLSLLCKLDETSNSQEFCFAQSTVDFDGFENNGNEQK